MADMAAIKPFFDDLRVSCPGMTFSMFKAALIEILKPQQHYDATEKLNNKDNYFG
jgi:hypothetical protein